MNEPLTEGARRPVRSFVLRAGRLGSGQAKALAALGPKYLIPYSPSPLDLDRVFGRAAPKVVEIGFGMGETTARIAAEHPEVDYLGVEVHTPGVGALLKRIGEAGLTNLRIVQHDATEVLKHMIPEAALDGVHIFFPDPWHKKRHHKRRLIQPAFVRLLADRLKHGGYLHLATDWEDYAHQMLEALNGEPSLVNAAHAFAPRPWHRPVTKFEQRGLRLGHDVWDLLFRRR
jgi:tRNA (guanine-N7-)-methyltransferase